MYMKNILKVAVVVIVAILLSASTYVLFFTDVIDNGEADDEAPTIDTITGNTTGTTGKITTISVTFSDNVEVTGAILYYKTAFHQMCIGCHKEMRIINTELEMSYRRLDRELPRTGPTGCIQCHPKE